MSASSAGANGLEIAIVGMAGRFPGAKNLDEFWRNLVDGVESIRFFSESDLTQSAINPALLKNPNYVPANGALDDIDLFDAAFFRVNASEAEIIDPQHRIFLELAWEAIESAGYDGESYKGPIGVYAGAGLNTYLLYIFSRLGVDSSIDRLLFNTGNDKDFIATRVSYKLNLKGPSLTVQTACSTSLVAVHLACQDLLSGACDMALAGGVRVGALQKVGYLYQEGGILSKDGHCRAFDASAGGTVGGNGAGLVVLKRLEDALADRDFIYAVIRGSAINNDGASKVGYTAPSVEGQARVIKSAHAVADVSAETITYIEAHGTGTELGDPIEIAALTEAFRAGTSKTQFCAVGSVKSNIGHLDAAAGIAGLIKTALSLHHKMIPPSLHFHSPNPEIDFAHSPFYVNAKLSVWEPGASSRRAGVSSFGIGGTNAHVIVEEFPARPSGEPSRPYQLLAISARTDSALEQMTANLLEYLDRHKGINLADVAFTLQVGRRRFAHRRALVCRDVGEAVEIFAARDQSRMWTQFNDDSRTPVIFMFPGQGSQYIDMAKELYGSEPVFREQVNLCSDHLKPLLGLDLRSVIYPDDEDKERMSQRLGESAITQPAMFVIEYAMAKLWSAWGVEPNAMIGHSIGEYVAACLAGVFSLEDALFLIAQRGRLMQALPAGAMLSVPLPAERIEPLLTDELSLAAINSPSSSVVSGRPAAVEALRDLLQQQGIACHRLHTSHAFHSRMMEPVLGPFRDFIRRINLNPPRLPYVSNRTGTWIEPGQATDPQYWVDHLRHTVRFSAGIQQLFKTGRCVFLEVGPGMVLNSLLAQHPDLKPTDVVLPSLRHPKDTSSDLMFLLKTLGQIWLAGAQVDWPSVYADERRQRLPLPTYPFERRRFWLEPATKDKPEQVQEKANGTDEAGSHRFANETPEPSRGSESAAPSHLETAHHLIRQQLEIISQQLAVFAKKD